MTTVATKMARITTIGHAGPEVTFDENESTLLETSGWAFDGVPHHPANTIAVQRNIQGWTPNQLSVIRDVANVFGEDAAFALAEQARQAPRRAALLTHVCDETDHAFRGIGPCQCGDVVAGEVVTR